MPQDTAVTARTKLFLAAAAAALTLAAGLTAGALLGFVRAPDPAAAGSPGPAEAALTEPLVAENPADALAAPEPAVAAEPTWAPRERDEEREHHGEGRGREEREEDDDD
jgi:hypothetical protein